MGDLDHHRRALLMHVLGEFLEPRHAFVLVQKEVAEGLRTVGRHDRGAANHRERDAAPGLFRDRRRAWGQARMGALVPVLIAVFALSAAEAESLFRRGEAGDPSSFDPAKTSTGHCHVAMRRAREVYALRIFKPPRRPRATWSSPRRVARGVIWLT